MVAPSAHADHEPAPIPLCSVSGRQPGGGPEGPPEHGGGEAASRAQEGPGAAPLGTTRLMRQLLAAEKVIAARQGARAARFERRQQSVEWLIGLARIEAGKTYVAAPGTTAKSADWVQPSRVARCRMPVALGVGVHGTGETGAHYSGVERCGSIWACPVCAAVIRRGRSEEVQEAVNRWEVEGGWLLFVTLTLRHKRGDPLALTLNASLEAFRRLTAGGRWQAARVEYGIVGQVRASEVTYGQNGWHPHVHALFFVEKLLDDDAVARFETWLYERWIDGVQRAGARLPSRLRAVDVRRSSGDGTVVAQYLSKLQDGAGAATKGIGAEMVRFDFKSGRGGSLTPFELLDSERAEDDDDDRARRALWWEYFKATKGRRAITWSRGLREMLAMTGPEFDKTDEEILAETVAQEVRYTVPAGAYRRVMNQPAILALILALVEDDRVAESEQLARYGIAADAVPSLPLDPVRAAAAAGP